jgi:phosphate transport system substrate-binding protein
MKPSRIAFILCAFTVFSCQNYDLNKDSVTSGKLKIGIDESYSLMMDSQLFVFNQLYQHAQIQSTYAAEGDIIKALMDDSIQSAVICRPLNEKEMEYFKSIQRLPESTKIAVDAVALIVNPANMDSTFSMEQLTRMFNGQDTSWKQVNPNSSLGKINIVFDNQRSCNERTIREKFVPSGSLPANCFAVHSNQEVIDYVNTNKNAIGIISVSWISDKDDPTSMAFLEKIKVVGIVDPKNTEKPNLARKPFQAYIYDGSYPLCRDVYIIRTGLRGTLGTGFASHVAGEKGQLIIHKMGMVAANAPTRVVKIVE